MLHITIFSILYYLSTIFQDCAPDNRPSGMAGTINLV